MRFFYRFQGERAKECLSWSANGGGNKQPVASAYLDGAEDRQKTGVLCMRFFCRYLGGI